MRIALIALLALLLLGCQTPRRGTRVEIPGVAVVTAEEVGPGCWFGEWRTSTTLTMTPQGPRASVGDAKDKSTIGSLGLAGFAAVPAIVTLFK